MGEPRESAPDSEPARTAEPPPKPGRSRIGGAWVGVALLLAAVAGALVVAVPGSARILQLRRANRNARRALTNRS